jgi:hypothetical protein
MQTRTAARFRSSGESCGSMNAEIKTIRILTVDDHALPRAVMLDNGRNPH